MDNYQEAVETVLELAVRNLHVTRESIPGVDEAEVVTRTVSLDTRMLALLLEGCPDPRAVRNANIIRAIAVVGSRKCLEYARRYGYI